MTELFHSPAFDWDKHLFQYINSHHSPFWDKVMWVITSAQFGVLFFLIGALMIGYYYRKQAWKILPVGRCHRGTGSQSHDTTISPLTRPRIPRGLSSPSTSKERWNVLLWRKIQLSFQSCYQLFDEFTAIPLFPNPES